MQIKMPLHLPRERIQVRVVLRNRFQQMVLNPDILFPELVSLTQLSALFRILARCLQDFLSGEPAFQQFFEIPHMPVRFRLNPFFQVCIDPVTEFRINFPCFPTEKALRLSLRITPGHEAAYGK